MGFCLFHTGFLADFHWIAYPIAVTIGNLVDPPATMINSAGDYVAAYIVSRYVDGKDWLQKRLRHPVRDGAPIL